MPRRVLALLLGLALAAPAARGGPDAAFSARLERAAKEAPSAAFADAASLPEAFKSFLQGKGLRVEGARVLAADGKTPLTNDQVSLRLFQFKTERTPSAVPPSPGEAPAGAPQSPAVKTLAPLKDLAGSKNAGASFDGGHEAPDAAPQFPETPSKKEPEKSHGLRILGIELGAGSRPDASRNEPFERKGQRDPLDWDVRARVKLEGLGARAYYRHPLPWRSFSLGFLKYFDVPGAIGLEGTRDGLYETFGATPEKPLGGFELTLGSQFNEHWGAVASFDRKESISKDNWRRINAGSLAAGYSPLGDNPGKPWNYTLLASANYQDLDRAYPAYKDRRAGFGYTAGLAFQYALSRLPWRWLGPSPDGNGWFWLDRAKATAYAADSQISSLSFNAALELSFYVSKHVLLTPGVNFTWRPKPEAGDPDEKDFGWGPMLGLDLKDLL